MLNEILSKIKASKKYKNLSGEILVNEIQAYLKSNPNIKRIKKQDIKQIKAKLHRLYASYQINKKNKRNKYLEELKQALKENNHEKIIEIHKKILQTNISARERLNEYESLYKEIFKITGIPLSIIDLGSGLNPLSFPFMNLNLLDYYAYEIDKSDVNFLNKYFEIMKEKGLNGKAEIFNIRNLEKISDLPLADIIFVFKLIDLLNTKNKKPGEELIKKLIEKTKFIVASFATKTLFRKQMNFPRRKGFELMLARNNLNFHKIEIKNEVFYVIYS